MQVNYAPVCLFVCEYRAVATFSRRGYIMYTKEIKVAARPGAVIGFQERKQKRAGVTCKRNKAMRGENKQKKKEKRK